MMVDTNQRRTVDGGDVDEEEVPSADVAGGIAVSDGV